MKIGSIKLDLKSIIKDNLKILCNNKKEYFSLQLKLLDLGIPWAAGQTNIIDYWRNDEISLVIRIRYGTKLMYKYFNNYTHITNEEQLNEFKNKYDYINFSDIK